MTCGFTHFLPKIRELAPINASIDLGIKGLSLTA
jgi:hypothetical protein